MSSRPELKLDWCSHKAAKWAVEHWHYSRRMPKSKLAKLGVWESQRFIGSVIFGVGATADLCKRYGIEKVQGCELVRVALGSHVSPTTKIIGICIRMLKREFPGLRLVVSFADPEVGHRGTIYLAGNWIYTGKSQASDEYILNGRRYQGRSFRNKYGGMEKHPSVTVVKGSSKHRFLMPLDHEMRKQIEPLSKPYPKRVRSDTSDTQAVQA